MSTSLASLGGCAVMEPPSRSWPKPLPQALSTWVAHSPVRAASTKTDPGVEAEACTRKTTEKDRNLIHDEHLSCEPRGLCRHGAPKPELAEAPAANVFYRVVALGRKGSGDEQ